MKKFLLVFLACLTIFWSLVIPASAAQPSINQLPDFPEKPYGEYTRHIVFYAPQSDAAILLYYDTSVLPTFRHVYNIVDGTYTFTLQGSREVTGHVVTEYVLRDFEWKNTSTSTPTWNSFLWTIERKFVLGQNPVFYYSSSDVVTPDGAVFFPATRLMLEQAVQAGLQEMKQTTDGNLMILTACGVGCLALLMGLLLLSNKFKNSLR